MTATEVLANFERRGVVLAADGAQIRYRAAAGVITDTDRAALREHKAELLALLAGSDATEATGEEDAGGVPSADARPAPAPRRHAPKERLSHEPTPTAACPACSGRRWRLRTTPSSGGEWLWACATCADRANDMTSTPPPGGDAPGPS